MINSVCVMISNVYGSGADWSIFNHASSWQRQEVAQLYGCNDMTTGRPSFLKMVGGLLVYPLYVIQVSPDPPTRSASSMHGLQHDSFMPTDVFVVSVISVFMS